MDRDGELANYLQPTAVEGLRLLTSGMPPPNPAELLGCPRVVEVMQALEDAADLVIYDSSPAATVTDAVVLAARLDAVLQVVPAGRTRRDVMLQGKHVLQKVGAHLLGPVLNRVAAVDLGYYSYYYVVRRPLQRQPAVGRGPLRPALAPLLRARLRRPRQPVKETGHEPS